MQAFTGISLASSGLLVRLLKFLSKLYSTSTNGISDVVLIATTDLLELDVTVGLPGSSVGPLSPPTGLSHDRPGPLVAVASPTDQHRHDDNSSRYFDTVATADNITRT